MRTALVLVALGFVAYNVFKGLRWLDEFEAGMDGYGFTYPDTTVDALVESDDGTQEYLPIPEALLRDIREAKRAG